MRTCWRFMQKLTWCFTSYLVFLLSRGQVALIRPTKLSLQRSWGGHASFLLKGGPPRLSSLAWFSLASNIIGRVIQCLIVLLSIYDEGITGQSSSLYNGISCCCCISSFIFQVLEKNRSNTFFVRTVLRVFNYQTTLSSSYFLKFRRR